MDNIVDYIQELILNSDKDFKQIKLNIIENKSGYDSIVISSEMTTYRPKVSNALFARIKTSGKKPYISFRNKYINWFIENDINTYSIKSETDFFRVPLSDFMLAINFEKKDFSKLAVQICLEAMNFPQFGCCDKFVQCSDAKKCVHSDLLYSTACMYRKNLENNKIFYGKNKNT